MKKKKGNGYVFALVQGSIFIYIIMLLASSVLEFRTASYKSKFIEKALKQSALSGLIYDVNEYGTTNLIKITDVDKSMEEFKHSLSTSLELDNNLTQIGHKFIEGTMDISKFIIYNETPTGTQVITRGDMGNSDVFYNGVTNMKTPSDIDVKHATLYVEVQFDVLIFGNIVHTKKDATVALSPKS